ncbi:glutamyl-tRNA reductase [Halobacteriales archaeon Cl-PHB]
MTRGSGVIVGVSVSHDDATVDDLETAAFDSQRGTAASLAAEPVVEEAFVLQTCNRVETYAVTDEEPAGRAILREQFAEVPDDLVVEMGHEESLRHLMRVAAGLESLVLGEDQILGQVRDAYEDARSVGAVGPLLEDGVEKAIRVGERARTETAINEGAISLASAAVRVTASEYDLADATALVVGAGEMGRKAAESLATEVDYLVVANRTVPHAEHVVDRVEVPAEAVDLANLPAVAANADVVVSATGSTDPVFDAEALAEAGETFVVDIAQPRDVPLAVGDLPNVTLRDLDTLEEATAETRRQREAAATEVETIIDEAFDRLLTQYKRKRADRVISTMYEGAERIKAREVETALSKLDLDDDEAEIVESMADAIVSQLLAAPTDSLRDAAENDDWSTIHTAIRLFDPTLEREIPPKSADVTPADIPPEMREKMPNAVLEQLDD